MKIIKLKHGKDSKHLDYLTDKTADGESVMFILEEEDKSVSVFIAARHGKNILTTAKVTPVTLDDVDLMVFPGLSHEFTKEDIEYCQHSAGLFDEEPK